MAPYSRVQIIGNVGRDPETRSMPDGRNVTSFSVAVNKRRNGEEQTDWYRVSAWGNLVEICEKYIYKGKQVFIDGDLRQRSYEKDGQQHTSLDVTAREIVLLGGKSGEPDYAEHPRAPLEAREEEMAPIPF